MSQLMPFVRAFRALAQAVDHAARRAIEEGKQESADGFESSAQISLTAAQTLNELGTALAEAATDLEQQIARDLGRTGSRPSETMVGVEDERS